MKTSWTLAVVMSWVAAELARGGLYNASEPVQGQFPEAQMAAPYDFPKAFDRFRTFVLTPLRYIPAEKVPRDYPLRLRYRLVTEAATSFKARDLGFLQQLSLSEYMIRRGNQEAGRLLENLRGEPLGFLALANLGTAEQLGGEYRKAARYLDQAHDAWPASWEEAPADIKTMLAAMRWGKTEFDWYRKVEGYHRKLVNLRASEKPLTPPPGGEGRGGDDENVDAIFGDAFAFDPKEAYLPGKLPPSRAGKLPADALPIVQQLLVWLPNDHRLMWLAAEVYNAQGEVADALRIFNEELAGLSISKSRYRPKRLLSHRAILANYKQPEKADTKIVITPPPNDDKDPQPTEALVDWRSLAVGFGAGLVVAFIAYWQIRETTRRRRASTSN